MSAATENAKHTFAPHYPLTLKTSFSILLLNILALLSLRYDLFTDFTTQLIGGFSGDGGLYLWLFKHNAGHLLSEPWFNTNALYPYTNTLAWSDNFILPSLLGKVFLALGLTPLVSYNLLLTIAMLLTGVLTTRTAYHLTGDLPAAIVGGILFMGSAYLSSVIGHPQLQFAFWLPLGVELFFRFLNSRSAWHGFLLGGCVTLSFLTTVYYSLFIILLCLLLLTGTLLLRPRSIRPKEWAVLAGSGALGCLPLLFFVGPYLHVQQTFGERHLYEPYFFSASLLSFFSSSASSLLYSWTASWSEEEAHLFMGVLPFLLLIPLLKRLAATDQLKRIIISVIGAFLLTGLCSAFGRIRLAEYGTLLCSYLLIAATAFFLRKLGQIESKLGASYLTYRSLSALLLFVFISCFVLALGPLGNPADGHWALGIFRIFFELLPGFDSIRATSRIGALSLLALSLLGALSLRSFSGATRKWFLPFGALLVLCVENMIFPHIREDVPPAPAVLSETKNDIPPGSVLAVLPFSGALKETGGIVSWREFARINVTAMNWALDAGLRTINGYSGQQTKMMRDFPGELAEFPDGRSLKALRGIAGLNMILYVPRFAHNFDRTVFETRLNLQRDSLRLVKVDEDGNYLMEIIGEHPLKREPWIAVPSYPDQLLTLDLKTAAKGSGTPRVLPVMVHDHYESKPLTEIQVTDDGNFHQYQIVLPATTDRVRPLRVYFRGGDTDLLVLGRVRSEAAPSQANILK